MNLPLEINVATAGDYLRQTDRVAKDCQLAVRELAGGVSNVVLLIEVIEQPNEAFVLKQARQQLRVDELWTCDIRRIWREIDVLQALQPLLASKPVAGGRRLAVPRLLWEDRANYCYAMSAVDPQVPTWKQQLLAGEVSRSAATAAGTLLGMIHAQTWQEPAIAQTFADAQYFDALRIDPYYRHVQRTVPELATSLQTLIASLAEHPRCLVHGDFSPKNLLIEQDTLTLLDFEVGHFGDPAFDVGFFFTHLVLKWLWSDWQSNYETVVAAAWQAYREQLLPRIGNEEWQTLRQRSLQNLGGCMIARVLGKSRVDYLSPQQQVTVRQWGEELLTTATLPSSAQAIFA